VTGFNSFQFAGDPVAALREARRAAAPGGRVVMVVWGRQEDCEHAATLAAVARCLPPRPPEAAGPFALSEPGRLEALMTQAGLTPLTAAELDCPFEYPDLATALRGIGSTGPAARAVQHAGAERVRQAIIESLAPYRTDEGDYRQRNTFRCVVASP
jgi:hypothetical protein